MIQYINLGIGLLAIAIGMIAIAFNLCMAFGWGCFVVFASPKPRGWRYWPWAWRFFREHRSWPI